MRVSDASQEVFMKLVAWECFGDTEINPKSLLREVPLTDLQTVSKNIKTNSSHLQTFACISMVELEVLYKSGLLQGDWCYSRKEEKVSLSYEPVSFPKQSVDYTTMDLTTLEHMSCVGAMV